MSGGEPGGVCVDPLRFRANFLIEVAGSGFPEDGWLGKRLWVGPKLLLRPVRPLTRCVMIDMAQDRASERDDLLKALAKHHELTFGVLATVERPGQVTVGDMCSLA